MLLPDYQIRTMDYYLKGPYAPESTQHMELVEVLASKPTASL
jgi:hypothetical protein